MNIVPRRSYATALTDDELILMDALFDKDLAIRHLQRKDFGLLHNTRRIPKLSNRQVVSTVERWVDEGILRERIVTYMDSAPYYGLTPVGGALWEAERTRDWRRFVSMSWEFPETPGERTLLSVFSPSKATGRAYIEYLSRQNLEPFDFTSLRPFRRRGLGLLSWKKLSYFVEWQILVDMGDRNYLPYDPGKWRHEDDRRVWWTDVDGLQRFLPATDTS